MSKVLVPHGTTPSGFGLFLHAENMLRALSPCCGEFLAYGNEARSRTDPYCTICKKDYSGEAVKLGGAALGNDVELKSKDGTIFINLNIIKWWVASLLGYKEEELNVQVEWKDN